jgi:uroporphyrinogen decarboxylase
MTQRERLLAAMSHKLADRVPAVIDARAEVQRTLVHYYGVKRFADVLEILGAEDFNSFPTDSMARISFPTFEKRAVRLDGDWLGAGDYFIPHDERTIEDRWGVVQRIGTDGKYVQWITGPLTNANDPDEYDFPGPDRFIKDSDLPSRVKEYQQKGVLVKTLITNPYKTAWMLRGMENLLADYLIKRDFVEKLYDRIFALYGEILRYCTLAGVDMIGFVGDIAMQDRLMMGPDVWRQVDKPRLDEVISSCKAINPAVHVFIHSDGDLSAILPDLIEIGFDVIDPIQPECLDPFQLKRLYGDKIVLHGGGSLQRTLPFGDPEDCRQEVIRLIEGCAQGGGLILRISNTIGSDAPVENIAAWYETARDYDLSQLPSL